MCVGISDAGVIGIYPLFEIAFIAQLQREPGKACAQIPVVEGRKLAIAAEVLVDQLLGQPVEARFITNGSPKDIGVR